MRMKSKNYGDLRKEEGEMSKFHFRVSFTFIFYFCMMLQNSALTTNQQGIPEPKYEVRLEKSHMVPMRDGIRLSTDLYIQQGIFRARYREGFTRKVWMKKGGVYKIQIDLDATSNYFKQGHRIRVQVSSSDFPLFERNLNTGGNNYDETEWVVAENTIHHSRKFPSHIVLPITQEEKD